MGDVCVWLCIEMVVNVLMVPYTHGDGCGRVWCAPDVYYYSANARRTRPPSSSSPRVNGRTCNLNYIYSSVNTTHTHPPFTHTHTSVQHYMVCICVGACVCAPKQSSTFSISMHRTSTHQFNAQTHTHPHTDMRPAHHRHPPKNGQSAAPRSRSILRPNHPASRRASPPPSNTTIIMYAYNVSGVRCVRCSPSNTHPCMRTVGGETFE